MGGVAILRHVFAFQACRRYQHICNFYHFIKVLQVFSLYQTLLFYIPDQSYTYENSFLLDSINCISLFITIFRDLCFMIYRFIIIFLCSSYPYKTFL